MGTLCCVRLELAGGTNSVGIGNTDIFPDAARVSRVCLSVMEVDGEVGEVEGEIDNEIDRASESSGMEATIFPFGKEDLLCEVSGTSQIYTKRSPSAMDRNRLEVGS